MLDNLFNGLLILSFLAISAAASVAGPTDDDQTSVATVAQLERVVVVGHSRKPA